MKLLDIPESARALRIGDSTMRRMIRLGEIPVVRIGGRILVSEEDLVELVKKNRKEPGKK